MRFGQFVEDVGGGFCAEFADVLANEAIAEADEEIANIDRRGNAVLDMHCRAAIAKFVAVLDVVVYKRSFVK
jgi:hypothetical protein